MSTGHQRKTLAWCHEAYRAAVVWGFRVCNRCRLLSLWRRWRRSCCRPAVLVLVLPAAAVITRLQGPRYPSTLDLQGYSAQTCPLSNCRHANVGHDGYRHALDVPAEMSLSRFVNSSLSLRSGLIFLMGFFHLCVCDVLDCVMNISVWVSAWIIWRWLLVIMNMTIISADWPINNHFWQNSAKLGLAQWLVQCLA